jgi:glutathione S-transferase
MNEPLTLWSDSRFTSPWVLSVWTALREKGVPFEVETLDLERGEHRSGEYPSRTLTAKVPAIRHGDLWLSESLAILEYLEEVFGPPRHARLFPEDRAGRARDRQIMAWLRSDLLELRRCMPFEGIFEPHEPPPVTPRAREEAEKLLRAAATRLPPERALRPTLADFDLAFALRRLVRYGHDLSGFPEVVAGADAIWARPSVRSWVAIDRRGR